MKKLIFLIGISGSGKSTYKEKYLKKETIVCPDDIRKEMTGDITDQSQNGRIWAMVPHLLQETLDKYSEAVLDPTNVTSGDRSKILKQFNRDEVERIAVVFDVDPEEAKKRIRKDLESGKERSNVPDDVIDEQYIQFKRGYKSIRSQFDKVINGNGGNMEVKKDVNENFMNLEGADKEIQGFIKEIETFVKSNFPKWKIHVKYEGPVIGRLNKIEDNELEKNYIYIEFPNIKNAYVMINPYADIKYNKVYGIYKAVGSGWKQFISLFKKTDYPFLNSYNMGGTQMNIDDIKKNLDGIQSWYGKLREIVKEEMKSFFEQEVDDEMEQAEYQTYQDMYMVPQSNWRAKEGVPMLDAKGNKCMSKLGEIHRIQTVDYDLMHHGEVVTECGDTTYSIDSDDFRSGFEQMGDEEGLKVTNESVIKEEVRKLVKIKDYFGKNIKGSIERLEEAFLGDEFVIKSIMHGKKYYASRVNQHGNIDQWEIVNNPFSNEKILKFTVIEVEDIISKRTKYESDKIIKIVDRSGKEMSMQEFENEYYGADGESDDSHLEQDFEDSISGTEDYDDLYEKRLLENIKTEMAVSPSNIKAFDDLTLKPQYVAERLEEIIDEAIEYLNNGKKEKSPFLMDINASKNAIQMEFIFEEVDYEVHNDPQMKLFFEIMHRISKDNNIKSDELEIIKVKLRKAYLGVGWNAFHMPVPTNIGKRGFRLTIILEK